MIVLVVEMLFCVLWAVVSFAKWEISVYQVSCTEGIYSRSRLVVYCTYTRLLQLYCTSTNKRANQCMLVRLHDKQLYWYPRGIHSTQ